MAPDSCHIRKVDGITCFGWDRVSWEKYQSIGMIMDDQALFQKVSVS